MTPDTTQRIYHDGTYLERNPGWNAEDSAWKARWIADLMRRNELRPASIGEVGCGAGRVLLALSREFPDVERLVGYDISRDALALCDRDARPNVSFVEGDMLEEAGAAFDLVLAIDVFEHVEDYFGFLRRLGAHGKRFIFHIPLDLSMQSVLRPARLVHERQSVGHLHYFTRETALATLADTGYRVRDSTFTAGSAELPVRSVLARMARIPRRLLFALDPALAARVLGGFSLLVLAEPAGRPD